MNDQAYYFGAAFDRVHLFYGAISNQYYRLLSVVPNLNLHSGSPSDEDIAEAVSEKDTRVLIILEDILSSKDANQAISDLFTRVNTRFV